MTSPNDAAGLIPDMLATGTQELVEHAKKFGLTWELRIARVVNGDTPKNVTAIFDGDLIPIPMMSLAGRLVVDSRVHVITVPPAGHFVVGYVSNQMITGQAGIALVNGTGASLYIQAVTFPEPFDVAPVVTTNIASTAGSTSGWISRAYVVTTTGFSIYVAGSGTPTWTNVPVHWIAVRPTS